MKNFTFKVTPSPPCPSPIKPISPIAPAPPCPTSPIAPPPPMAPAPPMPPAPPMSPQPTFPTLPPYPVFGMSTRLAHAYVPWQYYRVVYQPCEALEAGTLFPELNMPQGEYGPCEGPEPCRLSFPGGGVPCGR